MATAKDEITLPVVTQKINDLEKDPRSRITNTSNVFIVAEIAGDLSKRTGEPLGVPLTLLADTIKNPTRENLAQLAELQSLAALKNSQTAKKRTPGQASKPVAPAFPPVGSLQKPTAPAGTSPQGQPGAAQKFGDFDVAAAVTEKTPPTI